MNPASVLSHEGSDSDLSSVESGSQSDTNRDLLYMHELIGGRSYSKTPMAPRERTRHLRSLRRHILLTRCGGDETKLASDLAIYASMNGPAKLRRVWRERENAGNTETVTIQ